MEELKMMKIWFLWRKEVKPDGRIDKVPFAASGGTTGTSMNYQKTWVTYDEAVAAVSRQGASGVGFVIPQGYFFLDIDHRAVTDPFVATMLARFDSYAETSFSGNGIHIYGKVDTARIPQYTDSKGRQRLSKDYYTKNPGNGMELYAGGLTGRFAVFTGNVISAAPVKDCTGAVLETLDKDMRRPDAGKDKGPDPAAARDVPMTDDDVLILTNALRLQKNSDKFVKLYDRGDTSDYGSQSEADAALCAMIAFRVGNDPDAVDAVFRRSALYRDKWERDDYRNNTIACGIAACHGKFHRSAIPRPPFIRIDKKGNTVVSVPLLARYFREHVHYLLVRDSGKQGLLKYVYKDGCYRIYDNNMLMGVIKGFIAEYDEELIRMGQVNECLQNILTDLNYVRQVDLNADENYINFQNGLLYVDGNTMELRHHSPEVLSTIQIPCDWTGVPTPTPVFDAYMHTLTDGDVGVENLLLQFIGVCLSNVRGYRLKKALFLDGKGDTGKSQLKSLVEMLLGKGNYIGIDLKEIEARFGTGMIFGTRLAGSSDMSFMTIGELKTFKKATGGDSLFAEFKGVQGFEYIYSGMLWFCMNQLPKFGGDDGQWVYDRIMVVHCPNAIPKDRQDKFLLDKMYTERAGIVYKAIRALQQVIRNGYQFSEPEAVITARNSYKGMNNTVEVFLHECMCRREGPIKDRATVRRIINVYQAWCKSSNHGYAKTEREFRDSLADLCGCAYNDMVVHRKAGNFYKDWTLTDEMKDLYSNIYGFDADEDFLK